MLISRLPNPFDYVKVDPEALQRVVEEAKRLRPIPIPRQGPTVREARLNEYMRRLNRTDVEPTEPIHGDTQCWVCGRWGWRMDEFTSPHTGRCVECERDAIVAG